MIFRSESSATYNLMDWPTFPDVVLVSRQKLLRSSLKPPLNPADTEDFIIVSGEPDAFRPMIQIIFSIR